MAGKRKRHRPHKTDSGPRKRLKTGKDEAASAGVTHPTLSLYYPHTLTLKDYVLSKLPTTSKTRRRKIIAIGNGKRAGKSDGNGETQDAAVADVIRLLDRTLVCRRHDEVKAAADTRGQDLRVFSQRNDGVDESSLLEGGTPQSEIVDFAIWSLFHRIHRRAHKPPHMLCHGYQRTNGPLAGDDHGTLPGIPGIVLHYPNSHVGTLKSRPWIDLLNLLGKDGEKIMLELTLDCAIYSAVERGQDNYYQLSGTQLPYLWLAVPGNVLNRYPDPNNPSHTAHTLKYIFPRQFGLHNCFTSTVDAKQTTQPFQDYTLREPEITKKAGHTTQDASHTKPHLPKRLRGVVVELVRKLQKLHGRCAYYELLKHYCQLENRISLPDTSSASESSQRHANLNSDPVSQVVVSHTGTLASQGQHLSGQHGNQHSKNECPGNDIQPDAPIVDRSTPVANVSAFCRAVVANLVPIGFWGEGAEGDHNKDVIMRNIDRFICLKRFESLTLHVVSQDLKISAMTWLIPPNLPKDVAISSSDMNKRRELLLEFLYYLFDSILIPLIRSNFHVTESNHHKNRIFYFRHDVWRALTEPAMTRIKDTMFEEVPISKARQLLDARSLGFSQIRLLPKGTSLRPIMNLRRRVTKLQGGKAVLGRSINSIVAPVHKMLDFERQQNPQSVGSALFSVGDIYPKLKGFRNRLRSGTGNLPILYFAKVDVQSCFDTIPQRGAVNVMEHLASEDVYRIARHAQIKPSDPRKDGKGGLSQAKPERKFVASAHPPLDFRSFDEVVEETFASGRKHAVFVDKVIRTAHKKQKLLDLLKDHVERNIIKIGKKFFRQKNGIPQGSVLSSLLCNCFYAKLEVEHLSFINDGSSLLLRLIDDFLLITTRREDAARFVQVMHDGIQEYGVRVNPAKTLVNFEVKINGINISRATTDSPFPYCGTRIDMRSLEISKDRDRIKATVLSDALTVEQSSKPGQAFHRKAMKWVYAI
ncbi:MAG: hypothetical protein Q9207_003775 [Kuettlingeria erythrocarpa]